MISAERLRELRRITGLSEDQIINLEELRRGISAYIPPLSAEKAGKFLCKQAKVIRNSPEIDQEGLNKYFNHYGMPDC